MFKLRSWLSVAGIGFLLLASIPSYFDEEWAKFMSVFSNIAFILPIMVSYYNKTSQIILLILLVFLISSLYHTCKAYDVCAVLDSDGWMFMDVTYSWFTLLCLSALLAFGKMFWELAPLNAAIVIFSHEAHCKHGNFECRSFKMVIVAIYLLAAVFVGIRYRREFDVMDTLLTVTSFIIACSIYLFVDDLASHAIWHVFSALGFSFALTMHKPSYFHTLGFRTGTAADSGYNMDGGITILFPRKYEQLKIHRVDL